MFPLEIFPYASLSSSVVTTVWIGVIVIALFNLRLGWVLSGLVVPGYLVPLVIVKPMSVGLIVVESIVTYFVVLFLSESLSTLSRWSSIFGRDRFYALVVSSVLVRLLFDIVLIPIVGEWVIHKAGYEFDYRNELQSFGLIIVALMANQYWKTGIARGLFVLAVTSGITWFIVRYGLMEYTNFSIGNLRILYEDLAASLLSSPKAYIILLTTAYVCSRLNLRYGWDFNGILLPSLLALQWFAPFKILTSFVEAFIILLVSRQLLRLPWLARMNMEGARLLLLFFNVSFFYKMLLGFSLPWLWPDLKITDTYGFGYLLATLLALKMHQKDIIGRVSRVTLQASFVSIIIASLIGFSLTLISKQTEYYASGQTVDVKADIVRSTEQLASFLSRKKVKLHGAHALSRVSKPLSVELDAFQMALRYIGDYQASHEASDLHLASQRLASMAYQLTVIEGRYLVLHENHQQRGWGLYVVDTHADATLNFQVPRAVDDRWLIDASRVLFHELGGRTLAISSSPQYANTDGSSDMRVEPGTLFHTFHTTFARDSVVQLVTRAEQAIQTDDQSSVLRITDRVPSALDFKHLRNTIGPFNAKWNQRHDDNVHKQTARGGFIELMLSRAARESIVLAVKDQSFHDSFVVQTEDVIARVLHEQEQYLSLPTQRVESMTLAEMLYFDNLVMTPLLNLMKTVPSGVDSDQNANSWHDNEAVTKELRLLGMAAGALGYRVTLLLPVMFSQSPYVLLHDVQQPSRRWGLVLLRAEPEQEYIVHASQTTVEYGTLNYALDIYEGIDASVLTVSPGVSQKNVSSGSPSTAPLATLVGQIVMRENEDNPMLVVMPRAYSVAGKVDLPPTDVLIGVASGEIRTDQLRTPQLNRMIGVLQQKGLSIGFVDGSTATSGYQPSWLPQAAYLDATRNKELAAVWLSPQSRTDFRPTPARSGIQRSFAALGLRSMEISLQDRLSHGSSLLTKPLAISNDALAEALRQYQSSHDIVALRSMTLRWPQASFEHVKDMHTQQDYLLVANQGGRTFAVARLTNSGNRPPEIVADISAPDVIATLGHPDTTVIISGED